VGTPLSHPGVRPAATTHREEPGLVEIDAALDHGLSQGLIESTHTKIRVLTRIAFGFKHPEALISLAMLALGGYRPDLPHQQAA
jgi:transposase